MAINYVTGHTEAHRNGVMSSYRSVCAYWLL